MTKQMNNRGAVSAALCALLALSPISPAQTQASKENHNFFEQKIRPLFIKHCLSCHSAQAKSPQGGLLLDSREGWQKGGANGAVILPNNPANSRLVNAVRRTKGVSAMPPSEALSASEVKDIEEWIRHGAFDPRDGKPSLPKSRSFSERLKHWAFQPLKSITAPQVKTASWCRNPIDNFVLAKLEAKGLKPSPTADRRTLLRRLSFDLIGLPPTPTEMQAFLKDPAPNAYEKAVDRLLASPQHGERWGRHWLDVVHYGDTHGYDKDKRRDNAWHYRDYVIAAFNQDKPYTRFLKEQIAGDILYPQDPQATIATGFIAAGPWDFVGNLELAENTIEKAKTRNLDRDDMVSNALATFNSVTIHCARCHDHKFDPIPQKDYYRLQAVFAGVDRGDRAFEEGDDPAASTISPTNGYHSAISPTPDAQKWVQIDLGSELPLDGLRLLPARPIDFKDTPGFGFPARFKVQASNDPAFQNAITLDDHTHTDFPNPGNTPYTLSLSQVKVRYLRITATKLWLRTNDYVFALAEVQIFANKKNIALRTKVTALDSIEQGRWSTGFLTDGNDSQHAFMRQTYAVISHLPRPVHILARGEIEKPTEEVQAGGLTCLSNLKSDFTLPAHAPEGQRRAALANWLASPQNPLTWRSIVNRVWQYHFGRGVVETPNDFGWNGARPTHPELLEWLARSFRDGKQSLKALHKTIVMSATYQQSSQGNSVYSKVDSDNRYLWHSHRRRLDAEELRDTVLLVSGTLNLTMGGAGYDLFRFKDDHSPIYDHTAIERINDPKTFRRTVYRFTVRSVPNPFLESLDSADPNASVPVRNTTLTALQSLALLNNPFIIKQSELWATRLQSETHSANEQVQRAYLMAFSRPPMPDEIRLASGYLARYGLTNLCRLLLNSNEFVFID